MPTPEEPILHNSILFKKLLARDIFFFLSFVLWQDSIDMTGSEWEREMAGGNGKGPRDGIQSRDTRSTAAPYPSHKANGAGG